METGFRDVSGNYVPGELSLPVGLACVAFVFGALGIVGAAWGYGLLLIATLLLITGCVLAAIFILTRAFDTEWLQRTLGAAFWFGAWCYVVAVAALSGHYVLEAIEGRLDFKWVLFGPIVLAAIVVLDWGLYRILVEKNLATWERFSHVVSRDGLDQASLRQTLVNEVILHKTLLSVSPFRWLRHQLIFWGFGLMFLVEVTAVFVREAWPAFGFRNVWAEPDHPVRLVFDFAFDITGLMVMVGCILALVYRAQVNGTAEQRFTDTPTTVFLLVVVVSGFVVEGLRMAGSVDSAHHMASPVGLLFALPFQLFGDLSTTARDTIWLFHVLLSCAFIAYVPIKRLIHSCATPMGRLMNSQKTMLRAKKESVLRGLMGQRGDRLNS